MASKRRKKKKSDINTGGIRYIAKRIGIAAVIGTAVFFILCAASSLVILKKDAEPTVLPVIFLVISGICGLLCGFLTVKPIKRNGLVLGMTGALPAFFLIFTVLSIINRSPVNVTGWISLGIMTACGGVGGILGNKK